MKGLRIVSFGSLLPSKYVTNDDLAKIVDTSDEWIYERTGIHGRYFCDPD
ncbi:MAG: 3-oxoacyl-ACP synthase, partial [Lachnospiraceae bacterium]|nr:3-oxoacyl-ACP synthase [Lachnospiraceae bacterium]